MMLGRNQMWVGELAPDEGGQGPGWRVPEAVDGGGG